MAKYLWYEVFIVNLAKSEMRKVTKKSMKKKSVNF